MLSYDCHKMVAVVVAIVFVWVLAFTIGAPRATTGQTFGVFYFHGGNFKYSTEAAELSANMKKEGVFSYDVLDFNVREIGESYSEILLTSTTGESSKGWRSHEITDAIAIGVDIHK